MRTWARWAAACVAVWAGWGAGCRKPPEEKPAEQEEVVSCDPGPSPVRRLTRREYDNAVKDLLGDATAPARAFPPEEEFLGFTNNADTQSVSVVLAERYLAAAEEVAARAVQHLDTLVPCAPGASGAAEDACVQAFLRDFGLRAFRRPLPDEDVASLTAVFHAARQGRDRAAGVTAVLEVMLQSPEFLYRVERGAPVDGDPSRHQLDGFELASRLSFLLWGSVPDGALLAAAADGTLASPEGVRAEAARLLQSPRAVQTLREFHAEWLGLSKLKDLGKDTAVFPDYTPALNPLLRAEADAFLDAVWAGPRDYRTLFTAPYTYVNAELAAYYGMAAAGTQFVRRDLPPERAAGLLTQSGLLAVWAKPNQSSPIHRGKFVREQLLCQPIPPPPDNIPLSAPNPSPDATTRERFAQHRAEPACAGCHVMMDPVGFGFESFDGMGRFRATENGLPIDDSGEVAGTTIGIFKGVPELASRLVQSAEFQQCVPRQWFRFAHGRAELESDLCSLEPLYEKFEDSGMDMHELLLDLTQTDAFRFRRAPDGEVAR